jgi:alkylation response protein AidB-like acyl-CoA dehydrogenase
MDFRLPAEAEAFRSRLRAFLDEHMTEALEERMYRNGVSHDDEFTAGLAERGLLTVGLSERDGDEAANRFENHVHKHELGRADAPYYANGTTSMVASLITRFGTEAQRREILPPARRGEIVIVLGFSEPESGSDVASAQTRAVRDGEEWIINGSKMFTTNAHIADYVFLLTRTNPDVAKHKGLTTFLVPMKQPGVEVQAVYTLSGERTNITFYNDVRVADAWRIGEVDGGWRVMTASLQDEHSAGFGCRIERLLEEAEAWARESTDADGRLRIGDPDVRERLARCATDVEVSLLLERRGVWMAANGVMPEAEGPMSKLFSSEAFERAAQDLFELVGPDALRSYLEPTAPRRGRIEHALRFSLGTTIYGGTSEVQRNIIASRGLDLPR